MSTPSVSLSDRVSDASSALSQTMASVASSVSEFLSTVMSLRGSSTSEFSNAEESGALPGIGSGINPLTVSPFIDSWELIDGAIHVSLPETLALEEGTQLTLFTFENEQVPLWEEVLFINDNDCFIYEDGAWVEDNGDGTSSYNVLFDSNSCQFENGSSRLATWKKALIGGMIKKWV